MKKTTIEKIIQPYLNRLDESFSDCTNYEEALNGLPFFSVRWIYCQYKLGKDDSDIALMFVDHIYNCNLYLAENRLKDVINEAINKAENFTQHADIKSVTEYLENTLKK